ncbi:MAG TPA: glutamine synthetase family protein [Streptosporangiaceae bacterium]|nr:glutamine synthetase family protein [Streptosporangiaceae bacterium]
MMDADLPAGTEAIAICAPDNAGRLIGKRIPAERWQSVLADGLPMPDFHLITGIENIPLEGLAVTGRHRGFPNGVLRPCPETMCLPAWEPGSALVISDVADSSGGLVEHAPRSVLKRQVARLQDAGLTATFASELEFYLLRTPYQQAWASGYRDLEPSYHLHADNDILIAGYDREFVGSVRQAMDSMGVTVDQWQGEGGPGQHEINLRYADPLQMADRHVLYKHGVKAIAHAHALSATFMAKPFTDRAGSSCHVHLCLYDGDRRPVFGTEDLSSFGRSFLAGLLAYGPELALLHAPYANSYRRLQPDSFAPVNATWGWDNRTCMVRVVGAGKACRLEFKVPGADVNPYFSFAAILAAGLAGVDQGLEPPDPVPGDAWAESGAPRLPADLTEAVAAFARSKLAGHAFSAAIHQHLLGLAEEELKATRRQVTDWEIRRGFENA